MLKLDGTIIYQPNRGSDFKKKNKINTLIINFPYANDLSRYYIKLIEQELGPWTNLCVPMFGLHVTIIRGNTDLFDSNEFHQYNGKKWSILVDPTSLSRTSWSGKNPAFWTMNVQSKEINNFRKNVKPIYPFKLMKFVYF